MYVINGKTSRDFYSGVCVSDLLAALVTDGI